MALDKVSATTLFLQQTPAKQLPILASHTLMVNQWVVIRKTILVLHWSSNKLQNVEQRGIFFLTYAVITLMTVKLL